MNENSNIISQQNLPEYWELVPLESIAARIVDGSHNPPRKQDSGMPMLSARNIENNRIVFDELRYISEDEFDQENRRTDIAPGDVLLTIVGNT